MNGIRKITTLCVQFSDLNAHKFYHNFDCISLLCNCGMANEDNEHYLLHCLRFNQSRRGLFDTVAEVLGSDITNLDSVTICSLLLYGSYNLTLVQNRMIIEVTIDYIQKTNRLTSSNQGNLRDSLLQLKAHLHLIRSSQFACESIFPSFLANVRKTRPNVRMRI